MKLLINYLAYSQSLYINFLRISIFIVMAWIGGLKAFNYEGEGIVPFVANSPFMSFLYDRPNEYAAHKLKEGEVNKEKIQWNEKNGTYNFAHNLGVVIVAIGLINLLGVWFDTLGMWGGLLTFAMSMVTLSFLITTPESYVPDLGGPEHGFPLLSGAGRLVLKDVIMMAAGLVTASESAKRIAVRRYNRGILS